MADSYSRVEHAVRQQHVKRARDERAAAVGLPREDYKSDAGAAPQLVPRWFELPNAAAHGNKNNVTAYPEELWPTTNNIWRGAQKHPPGP